jgi:hypothetical protein
VTARSLFALSAAAIALSLAGCSAIRVNAYRQPGSDVTRYRTFAWASHERFATGDPRLDNNRFFIEHVQRAVERELSLRGLSLTSSAPDVLLHIHVRVDQRLVTTDIEPLPPAGQRRGAEVYDTGTLLLDFVDSRTNAVAWRGWAEGAFDGVIDDQKWLEETIDRTVAKILARFAAPLDRRS